MHWLGLGKRWKKCSAPFLFVCLWNGCAGSPPPKAEPIAPVARSSPESCPDLADCRSHCQEKRWPACERALSFAESERSVFLAEARSACTVGYAPACERAAWILQDQKDPAAVELATRSCSLDAVNGCFPLASLMRAGIVMPADTSSAFELFKRGCEAGSARSCSEVAKAYATGDVVNADPEQAIAYHEKACKSGEAGSCNEFAKVLLSGRGMWPDPARAVELSRRACESSGAYCLTLAELHRTGGLLEKDLNTARSLLQKACKAAPEEGCSALWAFELQEGDPKDHARAVQELAVVCEKGQGAACAHVGAAYRTGRGVTADEKRASEFFERSCEMTSDCEGLADLTQATGKNADTLHARALYERACFEARRWTACFKLDSAEAIERGMAEAEYECVAGNAATCEVLRARRLR